MKKIKEYPTLNQLATSLEGILTKRTGGAVNFRGVHYQVLYTCFLILEKFNEEGDSKVIRLEGIEDIDVLSPQISVDQEYIQLKSSVNKMDAGAFWNLGVLQNFLAVYVAAPESMFKLVYNMKISDGNLSSLLNNKDKQPISDFWLGKLNTLGHSIDYNDFLGRISFDFQPTDDLYRKILNLLRSKWGINIGTEEQFVRALFFQVITWSKNRSTVTKLEVVLLFQEIKDSYSKAPLNKAILNNWITAVSFDSNKLNPEDYYEGKAARPSHIGLGLHARRKKWEKQIEETITQSDVTVIKASSGQGKSTLGWQVGLTLKKSHSIYQIHSCQTADEANSIAEFLESRILIGEAPLVIIDGLGSVVSAWPEVAQRTQELAVKYLMTTRQEDWFRFGSDMSRINLKFVEISLSIQEAREIYEQFKRKGKIHSSIKEWQPVWEQVHQSGLLIEYTYLLTKGQMLQERLSGQLKYLSSSKSSGAKMEILRLTSLADCLNIRLSNKKLIDYIKSEVGFDQDRGEILNELEKEYFLNFTGQYIGGLHPVRSRHLNDLLHKNLHVEDSLLNLYAISDDRYKRDFFINAPLFTNGENKVNFYKALAEILSEAEFTDMVTALDGIMHGEPQRYWLENKPLFDEAFQTGGIELFSMTTVPFASLDTLDELADVLGSKGDNLRYLSSLKKQLPTYTFEKTDVLLFANALNNRLRSRSTYLKSFQGLGFLVRWFNILKLPLTLPSVSKPLQISDFVGMDLLEAKEWALYSQVCSSEEYENFAKQNKGTILSYLKVQSNSLTIEEINNEIHVHYLLPSEDADKANELSVTRIDTVYAFLPYYDLYCTEAILLPFPTEQLVSVVRQNSYKRLTPQTISNKFDVHLNQIWYSTVQRNYQEESAYSWQRNIMYIRETAVRWSKVIIRVIDALLEGNTKKRTESVKLIEPIGGQLAKALAHRKAYPKYEQEYFAKQNDIPEEKSIKDWFFPLGNINSQVLNIFIPKEEQDRNVAMVNLKDVYLKLGKMQEAFREMEKRTIAYFDSELVAKEEQIIYHRLYTTSLYYLSQIPLENTKAVKVAHRTVEKWWEAEKDSTLAEIRQCLETSSKNTGYSFVLPNYLEETETLTYCTFGIQDFDFTDGDALMMMLLELAPLASTQCHFFSIINLQGEMAVGGLRFKRDFFEALRKISDGDDESQELASLSPLPIIPDEKLISLLPGVKLPTVSASAGDKEKKFNILIDLWKLSEFRKRLNKDSSIEAKWLQATEIECRKRIEGNMVILNQVPPIFADFIEVGLQPNHVYNGTDIVSQIYQSITD